jgi:hypothetical protein
LHFWYLIISFVGFCHKSERWGKILESPWNFHLKRSVISDNCRTLHFLLQYNSHVYYSHSIV